MIETRIVRGVVPVVQTPITDNGNVDIEAQKRLINFLLESDVAGFWCLGTGSEDMNLTFQQRLQAARAVCEANLGQKPMILGAGFFALQDMFDFIDATKDLEFDAYHIMPYHPLLSLERIEWMYRRLADYAPKPLWMYTSANWCRAFPSDFVERLMNHSNVAGIKFSSSNTVDQLNVLNLQSDRFQVITAVANQFYSALAMGSVAGTSSIAGALPEPLMQIYRLYVSGKHREALDMQRHFMAFIKSMPKSAKRDNFITGAEEKYILYLRNICNPWMTGYYRSLNAAEQEQVVCALRESGYAKYLTGC